MSSDSSSSERLAGILGEGVPVTQASPMHTLYIELHDTATKRSKLTTTDMYYENLVENCRKAASHGQFEFIDEKMTREYFDIDTAIPVPPGKDRDAYMDELYNGQAEAYKRMEADGIKVELLPLDIPVVFPPDMPPREIKYLEYIRKTKECQVRLSWE